MLSQMTVLIVACIWHAIIFQFNQEDFAVFADRIALGVLGGIYFLNQLGFLLYWKIMVNFCLIIPCLQSDIVSFPLKVYLEQSQ